MLLSNSNAKNKVLARWTETASCLAAARPHVALIHRRRSVATLTTSSKPNINAATSTPTSPCPCGTILATRRSWRSSFRGVRRFLVDLPDHKQTPAVFSSRRFIGSSSTIPEEILETIQPNDNSSQNHHPHNPNNPWSGASIQDLVAETNRLEQYLLNGNKQNEDETKVIRLDDFFHVLEAWMEQAKDKHHHNNVTSIGRKSQGTSSSSAACTGLEAANQAESLLQTMQNSSHKHNGILAPTLSCYEVVLQAYAVCHGGDEAASRAKAILDFLCQNSSRRLFPTTKTYNIVLNALAKSQHLQAGLQADALYHQMMEQHEKTRRCMPNSRTIVTVMDAWAKSGHPAASERILHILQQILDAWEGHKDSFDNKKAEPDTATQITAIHDKNSSRLIQPDIAMFHAAMDAVVKSSDSKTRPNRTSQNNHKTSKTKKMTARQAATYVEDMLTSLVDNASNWNVEPNVRTFTIVLDAWTRVERMEQTGNAAHRAETLLHFMLETHYGGTDDVNLRSVKPNEISFTAVITAWSHAKKAQQANQLFQQLVKLFHASGQEADLFPTVVAANAVMTAWAKEGRPDFVLEIMQTLQRLQHQPKGEEEQQQPHDNHSHYAKSQLDLQSFNILLGAYVKAGQRKEALDLLRWMEGAESGSGLTGSSFDFTMTRPLNLGAPDIVSYNTVLGALSLDNEGQAQAEQLLLSMKGKGIQPDQVTYTNLLNMYARSMDREKVAKACKLLEAMAIAQQRPDAICTTAFIHVCAQAEKDERMLAFDMAVKAFDSLGPKRNHVAYATMAKALDRLLVWSRQDTAAQLETTSDTAAMWQSEKALQDERVRLLQTLLEECCSVGCLSENVYRELKRTLWKGQAMPLKPEWSKNVPLRQRPKALLQR